MKRATWLFLFLCLLGFSLVPSVEGASITGLVINENGEPVEFARVYIFDDGSLISTSLTDTKGEFDIDSVPESFEIIVYADSNLTTGVDYLPYSDMRTAGEQIIIELKPASSIILQGSLQFIDSEKLPLQEYYIVKDIDNKTLNPSGVELVFTQKGTLKIREVPDDHIIVPSNSEIILTVNSSILIASDVLTREFNTDLLETPVKGETLNIDVREYSIPINLEIANTTLKELATRLSEMEEYGFYTAKQEGAESASNKLVQEARSLYQQDSYSESFDSLKRGYIRAEHAISELQLMYKDASVSVYVLIVFLVAASLTTGYLLTEDTKLMLLADLVVTGLSLSVFYYTYPGSRIITIVKFLTTAAISFLGLLALSTFIPRILSVGSSDGRIHTRNLLVPIFSIAKRSQRRRSLRFLLTLTSITLLVMSFVTLTSFSEGYGIIETRQSKKVGWEGVFIREGGWTESDPTFILMTDTETDWLLSQPEVSSISPKAQNTPQRSSFIRLEGVPISGVLGFTSMEFNLINIESALISGSMPGDNGIVISNNLLEEINAELGDTVSIGLQSFVLHGVLDDSELRNIQDLDGEKYLPDKWINTNPEGEVPNWVLEPCEPDEVIFMSLENAQKLPSTGIQRVALSMEGGADPYAFAERLALERGYRSYASTPDEYILLRLGNYFEGRGFTLAIPWAIVVLNVIVTMLNSLYERRSEIEILSSVGLNPAQVSAIFVSEATIIGFIGGGLGYLLGLSFYKGMAILNIGLQVHQKVSAVWSLASIGLAISAVITGAFAALKNSVVITPSLTRRWKIDRGTGGFQEPWRITVPIKMEKSEVKPYLDYVNKRLKRLENHPVHITSSIRREDIEEGKKISFIYKSLQASTGNFYTINELFVEPFGENEYGARLESLGDPEWVHVAGSLIRQITMDFSTEEKINHAQSSQSSHPSSRQSDR
ncbi:FtsX-like permease family protein [Candidatus Bathyarchaeota archaeon]|nr:FtsX-like permease family protein [Candidatus Bathyarchaeota archaeon]